MPRIADVIQKAAVMGRFELFSNDPENAGSPIVAEAIRRLSGDSTLPENNLFRIAVDLGFYEDDAAAEHFRRHWLGEPPDADPFWGNIQDKVNRVLRQGALKACELYRDSGLPAEVWWVTSGAAGTADWQMSVTTYGGRILVVCHTPSGPSDQLLEDSQWIWIIQEDDTGTVVTRPARVPQGSEPPDHGLAALRRTTQRGAKRRTKRRTPQRPKKTATRGAKRATKKSAVKRPRRGKTAKRRRTR